VTWGWRREPARHSLAARGIATSGSDVVTSTARTPVRQPPSTPRSWELSAARRMGCKIKDQDELLVQLRKLCGFLDDGSKTFQVVPEGVPDEILEQRLQQLISEAKVGMQEGEAKQLRKDMAMMNKDRARR